MLGTTEEWLVAVSNERGGPHSFHVHTNYFAIVAHGDWDYQKGVLSYNETKPFGGWGRVNSRAGIVERKAAGWLPGCARLDLSLSSFPFFGPRRTGAEDVFLVEVGKYVVFRMRLEDFPGASIYVSSVCNVAGKGKRTGEGGLDY